MTQDTCMKFLVWSYYYHNITPEPDKSYGEYDRFTTEDVKKLDELKEAMFNCFEVSSVNNALRLFAKAKMTGEQCPYSQNELDNAFAHEK